MNITVDVVEDGSVVRTLDYDVKPTDTVEALASRVAADLGEEADDVLASFARNRSPVSKQDRVADLLKEGARLKHARACVDLRFETESLTHRFAAKAKWKRVHRFGCKRFEVPNDACANLELREGAPDGPALNENAEIGSFTGCKTVWLVKPGPEPNGRR
jgi:hypothetical protein